MKIDKKILKEFLRLKWKEIRWFLKYPFSIVGGVLLLLVYPYYKLAYYFAYNLMNYDIERWAVLYGHLIEPNSDQWAGGYALSLLVFFITGGVISGVSFWLKENWQQATKNVYPPKKKKR